MGYRTVAMGYGTVGIYFFRTSRMGVGVSTAGTNRLPSTLKHLPSIAPQLHLVHLSVRSLMYFIPVNFNDKHFSRFESLLERVTVRVVQPDPTHDILNTS